MMHLEEVKGEAFAAQAQSDTTRTQIKPLEMLQRLLDLVQVQVAMQHEHCAEDKKDEREQQLQVQNVVNVINALIQEIKYVSRICRLTSIGVDVLDVNVFSYLNFLEK